MELKNKRLLFKIIGGVSLVGLSLFLYYRKRNKPSPAIAQQALDQNISRTMIRMESVPESLPITVEIVENRISITTILNVLGECIRRSTKDVYELTMNGRKERRKYLKSKDIRKYILVVQDVLKLDEEIRETVLDQVVTINKISKQQFAESLNHYVTQREAAVMNYLTTYQNALMLNFPRKPVSAETYMLICKRDVELLYQDLQEHENFLKFKREFPNKVVISLTAYYRVADFIFQEFGVEEEDIQTVDLSSLSETQRRTVQESLNRVETIKNTLRHLLAQE
jgi:hypothetical protein